MAQQSLATGAVLLCAQVQMQADVRAVMSGHRQQRRFNSISSVAAALTQQHGVAGLWRGGLPAVQRAALVNLGELSTYDSVSHNQCVVITVHHRAQLVRACILVCACSARMQLGQAGMSHTVPHHHKPLQCQRACRMLTPVHVGDVHKVQQYVHGQRCCRQAVLKPTCSNVPTESVYVGNVVLCGAARRPSKPLRNQGCFLQACPHI